MNIFDSLKVLILDPFLELFVHVTGSIPTLLSAFVVLVVGVYFARIFRDGVHRILKEMNFDHVMKKIGLSGVLNKGGVKSSVSELVSSILYLIVMVIFLVMTVEVVGLTGIMDRVDGIVSYIPHVFSGVIVLVLGMILATIASSIVSVVANLTHTPNPKLFEKLTHYAVILYAATIALGELGYAHLLVGRTFHMLIGGIIFAFALAFGLGGKDAAAKYLGKKTK